jgi:hypothetical protein
MSVLASYCPSLYEKIISHASDIDAREKEIKDLTIKATSFDRVKFSSFKYKTSKMRITSYENLISYRLDELMIKNVEPEFLSIISSTLSKNVNKNGSNGCYHLKIYSAKVMIYIYEKYIVELTKINPTNNTDNDEILREELYAKYKSEIEILYDFMDLFIYFVNLFSKFIWHKSKLKADSFKNYNQTYVQLVTSKINYEFIRKYDLSHVINQLILYAIYWSNCDSDFNNIKKRKKCDGGDSEFAPDLYNRDYTYTEEDTENVEKYIKWVKEIIYIFPKVFVYCFDHSHYIPIAKALGKY